MLEFRVLGPVEVLRDGTAVDLGRRRERVLLASLLLAANRVVPADRLSTELWGAQPPPSAASALRVHVSRLRRALSDDVLATRSGGYVLKVDPQTLDAATFERLAAAGRAAAAAGDPAGAAARLRGALTLWRGPAYADLADVPSAAAEAARLEEARLAVIEDRVQADLECGLHREVVGELEALTGEHPLRERLWELRMLALYRSSRQADALAAFQALRRHLGQELGLDPGAAVRALEGAILRQDPALDAPLPTVVTMAVPAPAADADRARTLVTVLVTDLVGSTALRASLGEEHADTQLRRHTEVLTGIVQSRGGRVVKGTGDGVIATFGSASDALTAAVEIQRGVAADNDRPHVAARLAVRIGLSVGDVSWENGDCFGTPVVEAARLEAHAGGGQILCTDFVRVMAHGRGGHRFAALGELALKGLPEPVTACLVEWRPAQPRPAPLPSLLAPSGRIFVGRDGELVRLRELWDEAAAGPARRLALIGGEPGIGKTRLAAELAVGVIDQALVLAGRCDEDLGMPYQPFVEALRHYLAHAGDPMALGRHGGELVQLVPELAQAQPASPGSPHTDPETEQYRLFDAVAAWLAAASARRPILLVLDDLHWAAKPTLLMLRHILRYAEPIRLLVVATYRDTDVGAADAFTAWAADLRRERDIERLTLSGLDEAGVIAFVDAAREAAGDPTPGDARFAQAVWRETEGNPFFLTEVLRHLVESGAVVRRGDRWVTTVPSTELGIPQGVRDVVGRRLGRLGATTNRLLALAAVAGSEFDPHVVRVAADVEEDDLLDALDEAVGARLLVEVPPRYRFAHALVRATVHDGLSTCRRRAMHGRIAAAIETVHAERLEEHLPALALHTGHAGSPAAADYAARAGRHASAQFAHDQAAGHYAQGLRLLRGGDPRRLELMINLGEAQRSAGDPAHRQTLLDAARLAQQVGDADRLARAALANGRGPYNSVLGMDEERIAVLEEALRVIPPAQVATRARLLATLAVELHWGAERARRVALSDEALHLARASGCPATIAHVLLTRPQAIVSPNTLELRLTATEELLALAASLEDPVLTGWAHCLRSRTLLEVPDLETARRHHSMFAEHAPALAQPLLRWYLACTDVGLQTMAGRFAEAESRAAEAARIGRETGQHDAEVVSWCQRFAIQFHRGRLIDLPEVVPAFAGDGRNDPHVRCWFAAQNAETGHLDKAAEWLDLACGLRFAYTSNQTWYATTCWYACAAAAVGDRSSAAILYGQLLPYRGRLAISGAMCTGAVAHWLGVLSAVCGRPDEADAHFTAAAATHEHIAAPPWLARTQLEWGETLLSTGRPDDAARGRDLLRRALHTAHKHGLQKINTRASAALAEG